MLSADNYNSALNYLFSLRTTGTKLGLESISFLLDKLDSPQKCCDYIHIAGTNGKGSTAALLAHILQSAGLNVGLFTSPHLTDFRERFRVNSIPASKSDISSYLKIIDSVVNSMNEIDSPRKPTFFEVVTAMAALHFKKYSCDVVILETGMGGRLDATNAIDSVAQVITKISYDHTKWLGNSLDKISFEKAGIIKQGSHVFTSNTNPNVIRQILSFAINKKCRLSIILPENPHFSSKFQQIIDINDLNIVPYTHNYLKNGRFSLNIPNLNIKNAKINLLGLHQVENAALAAVVADWYINFSGCISNKNFIKIGLANVKWRGRCEIISENPLIIIDCAHNSDGIAKLVDTLNLISSKKWTVVIGILEDKNIKDVIKAIISIAKKVLYIRPSSQRGLSFSDFKTVFSKVTDELADDESKISLTEISDIRNLKNYLSKINRQEKVIICGSCYLVGDFLHSQNECKNEHSDYPTDYIDKGTDLEGDRESRSTRDARTDDPVYRI